VCPDRHTKTANRDMPLAPLPADCFHRPDRLRRRCKRRRPDNTAARKRDLSLRRLYSQHHSISSRIAEKCARYADHSVIALSAIR
jgi:hypothetical protein